MSSWCVATRGRSAGSPQSFELALQRARGHRKLRRRKKLRPFAVGTLAVLVVVLFGYGART